MMATFWYKYFYISFQQLPLIQQVVVKLPRTNKNSLYSIWGHQRFRMLLPVNSVEDNVLSELLDVRTSLYLYYFEIYRSTYRNLNNLLELNIIRGFLKFLLICLLRARK
jgi:hypothetical protein